MLRFTAISSRNRTAAVPAPRRNVALRHCAPQRVAPAHAAYAPMFLFLARSVVEQAVGADVDLCVRPCS
jgi:hypothetical protein